MSSTNNTVLGVALLFEPLNPSGTHQIQFSRPMDKGIRIISPELLVQDNESVVYGDEIDLRFWGLLRLEFGRPRAKVVCIGDSLTSGYPYTSDSPSESEDLYSWTHTFRELSNYEVINKGVFGENSSDMLSRFVTDVVDLEPDYCIIQCGMNDGNITSDTNIPLSDCLSNIQSMVDLCLANNITPIFAHYSEQISQLRDYAMSISEATYVHNYLEGVREFEQGLGYRFLDFTPLVVDEYGVVDTSKFSSDFIHPNEAGYELWGQYANREIYNLEKNVGTYLTRQDGYRYVYNHIRRVFDAYDNNNNNFVHTTDIRSIADMNIDFTIHKSHQFEIIISPDMLPNEFIFPATIIYNELSGIKQDSIDFGVNNIALPDRVRPYSVNDYDNPTFNILHIGRYDKVSVFIDSNVTSDNIKYAINYYGLNKFWDIDWSKNYPTNYFYLKRFDEFSGSLLPKEFRALDLDFRILLPLLSKNMYPDLMPIERSGETQNNRPIYEPWLIESVKYLYNRRTIDIDDDFKIPIFDLSPTFG